MRATIRSRVGRAAFTLIELLVVIVLVMVLAGIVVMFLPRVLDSNRAALAGTMVQNSLQIARSRALREQAPRGIRLIVDTTVDVVSNKSTCLCRELVYIEQPEDFTGGEILKVGPDKTLIDWATNPRYTWVYLRNVDLRNNSPPPGSNLPQPYDATLWSVIPTPDAFVPMPGPGDFLEVHGTGQVRRIVPLPHLPALPPYPYAGPPPYTMDFPPFPVNRKIQYPIEVVVGGVTAPRGISLFAVQTPFLNKIDNPTTNYRIIRSPRVTGEEPILLPEGTAIDFNTNWRQQPPPTPPPPALVGPYGFNNLNPLAPPPLDLTPPGVPSTYTIDILFAPNGRVLSPTVTQDFIALWVRDTSSDTPTNWNPTNAYGTPARYYAGEPSIIGIHVGSGAVVANDPDQTLDPTYPPNPPGWAPPALSFPWWMRDPYSFMKEGRSAGK